MQGSIIVNDTVSIHAKNFIAPKFSTENSLQISYRPYIVVQGGAKCEEKEYRLAVYKKCVAVHIQN